MFVCCLSTIVMLLGAAPEVGKSQPVSVDASSQAVVIFVPTEGEIEKLTNTGDLAVQEFLSNKIAIEERIRSELPGAALIVTESESIIAPPNRTITRSSLHGFGFVVYCPTAGVRIYSGVMNPDDFMREVHALFERRAPNPSPVKAPPPLVYRPPYAGTWRGDVRQWFVRRYSVVMTLQQGSIGSRVGTISYPEVPCTGVLELTSMNPTTVVLKESIQSGICVTGGSIQLTITGSKLGKWEWFDERGRNRASANLLFLPAVTPQHMTAEPPPIADDTASGYVGTVIRVDLSRRFMEVRSDATGATIVIGVDPGATFHGFGGMSGTSVTTDVGQAGLLKVKPGDRIQVSWSQRSGGARIAGVVTLRGRPVNGKS